MLAGAAADITPYDEEEQVEINVRDTACGNPRSTSLRHLRAFLLEPSRDATSRPSRTGSGLASPRLVEDLAAHLVTRNQRTERHSRHPAKGGMTQAVLMSWNLPFGRCSVSRPVVVLSQPRYTARSDPTLESAIMRSLVSWHASCRLFLQVLVIIFSRW
jgi:hypothetical protein